MKDRPVPCHNWLKRHGRAQSRRPTGCPNPRSKADISGGYASFASVRFRLMNILEA